MEIRVAKTYRLLRKFGEGSFGQVWEARCVVTGRPVAVKLESIKVSSPHLLWETRFYKALQGVRGVPKIFWYGCEGDFTCLVMELLGPSLEDLMNICSKRIPLSTISMIGCEIVERLKAVHDRGIIHRDLKPHNCLTSVRKDDKTIYLIDFGLARSYRDTYDGSHIPYREGKPLTGTVRYVSSSTHLGMEQSRRDELESVAYVLLNLYNGSLPWQGLKTVDKRDKYDRIGEKKLATPIDTLCKDVPSVHLVRFLTYTRALGFTERPDYDFLKQELASLFWHDWQFRRIRRVWATKEADGEILSIEDKIKEADEVRHRVANYVWVRRILPDELDHELMDNEKMDDEAYFAEQSAKAQRAYEYEYFTPPSSGGVAKELNWPSKSDTLDEQETTGLPSLPGIVRALRACYADSSSNITNPLFKDTN